MGPFSITKFRAGIAIGAGIILAMTLWFAWPGLGFYFGDDDITNLWNAMATPTRKLIWQIVAFSPEAYRPVGLLWYKAVLSLAGTHPAPFRIASMCIVLLNLGLMYAVSFALTESVAIALLAALIGCFHSRMSELYFSPAYIYDILCYTFYFAGLLVYVRRREKAGKVGLPTAALVLLLQILALGAKEMAVTFPVILVAYEMNGSWRKAWREAGLCVTAAFVISAIFVARKLAGATLLNQVYRTDYSPSAILDNWSHYTGFLIYRNDSVPAWAFAALMLTVAGIALWARSKATAVAAALIFISPLPVLVVQMRGLNMLYISMAGWALLAACVLARVAGSTSGRQAALFLCTAAALSIAHYRDRPDRKFDSPGRVQFIQPFLEDLNRLAPQLPPDPHIRLLDDPFATDEWFASMIFQIYYRRPDLEVLRDKVSEQRAAAAGRSFTVFTWRGGHLTPVPFSQP